MMSRQMKDSGVEWIGMIPEDWEVRKIKNYYNLQTGFTPDSKNTDYYSNDGVDWVTISDLNGRKLIPNTTKSKISQQYIEKFKPIIVPAGSLLYSFKLSVGQVAMTDREVYTNEAIASFIRDKTVNLNFLYYSSYMIVKNANENIYGAKILNQELINNAYIVFPPLNIQQKIADFLDEKVGEIDSIIEKTKETIEDYKKYKQAIITEAVTKGLNPNVEMKDSKNEYLGKIPAHWIEKRLRFLGTCQNGISKSSEYFGEGYPFVSYGDVYKNITLPEKGSGLIRSNENDRNTYSVRYGDVFFTRTSETIEEVGFASTCLKTIDDATFAGFVIRFRPNNQDELSPEFSKYYFRSDAHRKFFVKEMNLVTRASLSQELLKKLPVLLPPIEEQKEIANFLDEKCSEIDKLITKKEELLADLESYKKSLIYEYVTGKKEVQ